MKGSSSNKAQFLIRWLASRTVRRATELRRQVRRLINEQRDQLSNEAIAAIVKVDGELAAFLNARGDRAEIERGIARLEEVANEQLLPYPNGALRENVKEIAVAVTVIFAFTTFFLQLTKIPTNSLVPTLYGITAQDLREDRDYQIPGRLRRFAEYWWSGVMYYHIVAKTDGKVEELLPPTTIFPFIKKQKLRAGGEWYTIWFPPEGLKDKVRFPRSFRAGEDILKLRVVSGDHLLVDRLTYNFRRPQRGEIFVFKTKGIDGPPEGQLYIKRLVALSGERVRIGDDQHLIIDGQRLDASTPRFEHVYTFPSKPKENEYFGHVNATVAARYGRRELASRFPDERYEYQVGPQHYLAMGDNTMNSWDSRAWGDVPRQNVIGKCWFVYWPFTERFGWGVR